VASWAGHDRCDDGLPRGLRQQRKRKFRSWNDHFDDGGADHLYFDDDIRANDDDIGANDDDIAAIAANIGANDIPCHVRDVPNRPARRGVLDLRPLHGELLDLRGCLQIQLHGHR